MPLRPKASLGVGLATAGLVFAIHSQATPSMADIRVARPNDEHIEAAERTASWTSVAVVSAISLMAKDPTIFIIGGTMVVVMAWWTRHANTLNPLTGSASSEGAQVIELPSEAADEGAGNESDVVGF